VSAVDPVPIDPVIADAVTAEWEALKARATDPAATERADARAAALYHCAPACRACEAQERLGAVATILDDLDEDALADALRDVAERAGRKDHLGNRLQAAVLNPSTDNPRETR
jgi:hypothetical protein